MPKEKNNWTWTILFILILGIGFIFRLAQLTASDFWYDEAFTAIVIRAPWNDMWAYLAADKLHPPLYYLLLRSWVSVFGASIAALRGFSLMFGTALLPMIYLITQQLHLEQREKKQFGLVMMSIFAFSPFFITYSVEARSYSFLAFLILLAVYFFFNMIKKLYKISWFTILFIGTLIAITFTHYVSILVILGFASAYALLVMIDKKWFSNVMIWTNITKLLLLTWIGVTYFWHFFQLDKMLEKQNLGWILPADLSTLLRVVYVFLFGVDRQVLGPPTINQLNFPLFPNTVGFIILFASLVAVIIAMSKLLKKQDQLSDLLILLSVGLVPLVSVLLASSLGLHIYVDRYVIGYGTLLLLAFGYAWWTTVGKSFAAVLVGYVILLSCVILPQNSTKFSDTYDTLTSYGNREIVIDNPFDFVVFKSYFGDGNVKVLQASNGSYYDWALISRNEEVNFEKLKPESFVVWNQKSDRAKPEGNSKLEKFIETNDFVIYQVLD